MKSPYVYILYADTSRRRQVLANPSNSPDNYLFFGLKNLEKKGYRTGHNLEKAKNSFYNLILNIIPNRLIHYSGGYGGDWASILRNFRQINQTDIILSTADRTGIPLVLLNHLGLIKPPIIYISVGLPERLTKLKYQFTQNLYKSAFKKVDKFICYGFEETQLLKTWFDDQTDRIRFIPFFVDIEQVHPSKQTATTDIISIGADIHRDFPLLLEFAQGHPNLSIHLITSPALAQSLTNIPTNVHLEVNIPLTKVFSAIEQAKIVVLPIKPNSYSGGTTVLLQAMALAKPVIISKVGAIRYGYYLRHGDNCYFVQPEDVNNLQHGILSLLADEQQQQVLGQRARQTVEDHLSWEDYFSTLKQIIHCVLEKT